MEVGFIEHHDRLGSAFPGDGEVALDAAKIEILIERGDEQDGVDIGGDNLLGIGVAGGAPGKLGSSRQHGMDVGPWTPFRARMAFARSEPCGDPVAYCGEFAAGGCVVKKPSGALGGEFAVDGEQLIRVLVLERDAGGHEVAGGERLVRVREEIVPAER